MCPAFSRHYWNRFSLHGVSIPMPLRFSFYIPVLMLCLLTFPVAAQGHGGGRPAAKVEVAGVHEGTLAPQSEFRGTVYFKQIAEVATAVRGKVTAVFIKVGQPINEGDPMVTLDVSLLEKERNSFRATYNRYRTELRDAEVRFSRAERLLSDGIATPELLDDQRFRVESLQHQTESAKAELERIEVLMAKSTIRAPFDGIVVARRSEVGEWKSEGADVAVLARNDFYEVIANVPERYLPWIVPGSPVAVSISDKAHEGEITAIVPRGDIATRTFSVKVKVLPQGQLFEGMSAIVNLPTAAETTCMMVNRDAVLQLANRKALFTVHGGVAVQHDVKVIGYDGALAGVVVSGLSPEDRVIVKGHERLRDGSPVEVLGAADPSSKHPSS